MNGDGHRCVGRIPGSQGGSCGLARSCDGRWQVDPSKLAAECDRAVHQMDMQLNILGEDSFKTDEDFCAVFVDLVLPIDEEPECMRFVEDVSHEHLKYAGVPHHWPRIVYEKHFDEAFMTVCLEDASFEIVF